ncbi:hypothetical protein JOD43_000374 [Pullulanibacillus pueri]|uniref:Flagellar hook-length control protein FliK n=1 Tax=Pullulanibacillus pueri TaxID=1437324 RepID=A0A8J2ZRS3_9BACL|nr:hypothetical protein [Pullulanibacillus pueri]MBM7680215.1 hypothetical protein [Pullulanibacillus pueri]GGH74929.1 hypothetical protein GCM10007096_03630 [Pullulanibacillus pueri]
MLIPPVGPTDRAQANQFRLSDGQMFKGKVLGMTDDSEGALVEIGGRVVRASVQVPVETGKSYLFQYLDQKPQTVLKVIQPFANSDSQGSSQILNTLIQRFSLPQNSQTVKLLNFFLEKDLPLRGPLLKSVFKMVQEATGALMSIQEADLDVLEFMLRRELPLQAPLYQYLISAKKSQGNAGLLSQLVALLEQAGSRSKLPIQLQSLFETWPDLDDQPSSKWLFDVLNRIGYFQEAKLANPRVKPDELGMTLKTGLLAVVNDKENHEMSDHAEKLLAAITGQQLQSLPADRSLIQWLFTLPVLFNHEFKDVQMLWEGKKNEQGDNETEYYKILFYFDFKVIGETVVRILTQRKMLTVTLFNDTIELEPLIEKYKPQLQERLSALDYTLVSLTQINGEVKQAKQYFKSSEISWDVKI